MPLQTRTLLACLTLAALLASACGDDAPPSNAQATADDAGQPDASDASGTDDVADEPDAESDVSADVPPEFGDVELPPAIVAVDTVLPSDTVSAGSRVEASCQLIDENGEVVDLPEAPDQFINHSPTESFEFVAEEETEERYLVATRVGAASFTCSVPDLNLIDPTPAELTIVPGPPHTVVTEVDTNLIVAGGEVQVGCHVYDAWGNPIEDASPTVTALPTGDGVEVIDRTLTLEKIGLFTVSCQLDGAGDVVSELVEVTHALPANLVIAKQPDQRVYAVGQVVSLLWTVTDRYGNIISDPALEITSNPAAAYFGEGRYRFDEEGTFVLTVTVTGPTENNVELSASTQVVVNGSGPAISCDNPANGAILDASPSSDFELRGRVADANGVAEVRVAGEIVDLDRNGRFTYPMATRFGINFVDIVALDEFGEENSTTCSFLISNTWAAENGFFNDGVTLRLAQSGVDDGGSRSSLNSLNDILYTVVNSDGLVDQLKGALEANDPLKPYSCHERWFGACVLSSTVRHEDSKIDGPNETTLELVNGGLRAKATLRGLGVRARVNGRVAGIGYDTTGWVTMDTARVDVTFDLALRNGDPRVTVRRLNEVYVSNVDTSFGGLDGFIINIVVDLFQGTIRNLIRDTLRDYIRDAFDDILDGLVSSLDISSLGSSFNVPRLDGGDPIRMGFGVRFSSLLVNGDRALFGLGTQLTAPITHGGLTYGAPIPPGAVRRDPNTDRPIAAAVNVGVINQALHTLWRGGLFDANINGSTLGGFPAGTTADIRTNLPPVAVGDGGGKVQLTIGAMTLALTYPGIFDEPLVVVLGARARTAVQLDGEDLNFSNVQIQELFFATPDTSLAADDRQALEDFLRSLLQSVIDDALNDALPALPIPAFTLPAAVGQFDLPDGSDLGIVSPRLDNDTTHFVLDGQFGVQ